MALLGISVAAQGQVLTVTPQHLDFTDVPSGGVSSTMQVEVVSTIATTLNIDQSGSPGWLTILSAPNPNIGAGEAGKLVFDVLVNAASLSAGTHQGSFIVKVNGAATGQTVTVTATVIGSSVLTANPSSLAFTAVEGDLMGTPASASVQISSSGDPLTYTVQTSVSTGNWLTVSTAVGSTGGSGFTVGVAPSLLDPGTYQGTVTVSSTSTSDTVQIAVTLTVNADATLSLNTENLHAFLFQIGQTPPGPQTIQVSSSGGAVAFNIGLQTPASWLVVSPLSGAAGLTPVPIALSVNPSGLAPGTYTTALILDPENGPTLDPVPVKLVVSVNPILQLSKSVLGFSADFGGAAPAAQSVSVTAVGTGGAIPFTVSADQSWVTVQMSANQTNADLSVSVNPVGLSIGVHEAVVTVTPGNGDNYTQTFQVSLEIADVADLTVGPGALLFSYQNGGAVPPAQVMKVTSRGQPVDFQLSTSTSSCNSSWLMAQANTSTTPALVTVSVNPVGVPAGTCSGKVTVSYTSGNETKTLEVPVTVAAGAAALLSVSLPQDFGVITIQEGQVPTSQTITLTSTDPGQSLDFNVTTSSNGGPWLQSSGAGSTPNNSVINYFTGSLAPGLYTGQVVVSSLSLPQINFTIPVTVLVLPDITVTVDPNILTFLQSQGGPPPVAQAITLSSTAPGATFTATIEYSSGSNWLELDRTSGVATGTISARVLPNTLPQNFYSARVRLSFQNSSTPSVLVTVVLTVAAPRSISSSVSSVQLTYQTGGSLPTKSVQVSSTPTNLAFTVGATSSGWLKASPESGTTPGSVEVSADVTGLALGDYQGSVSITSTGATGSPIVIPVTLTVTGPPPPGPLSITNNASSVAGVIAPGELITIKGSNLGPSSPASGVLFSVEANNTVVSTLAGVRVLFDNIPGTPIYVSDKQINVTVPYEVGGRVNINVVVEYQGVRSDPIVVRLEDVAPGIYTMDSTGYGQAAALNQNYTYNGPAGGNGTSPAAANTTIALYMTGGGQTGPASVTGSVTPTTLPLRVVPGTVSATIGGLPATVQFIGSAPGLVTGVIQVNLLPDPSVHGDALPVVVTIRGVSTPIGATVAVQ